MARKNRITWMLSLALVVMLTFSVPAAASSQGSILLQLPDGISTTIYKVADYNDGDYTLTEILKDSGADVEIIAGNPSEATATAIHQYMKANDAKGITKTASGGNVNFSKLSLGIWLVTANQDEFKPFLAFTPNYVNGGLTYTVYAAPKAEENDPDTTSIYVMKRWDDKDNAAGHRPDSITVDLLLDGEVVATGELSSATAWTYTFDNLKKIEGYTVEEHHVERYDAEYGGDEKDGFVITNVYNESGIPQTGQYSWPIAIVIIAGLACVALAVIDRRERGRA